MSASDEKVSAALYAGMVAYSKEHRRIRAKGPDRVNPRAFLVAAQKFAEEMAADDDVELIEEDETP